MQDQGPAQKDEHHRRKNRILLQDRRDSKNGTTYGLNELSDMDTDEMEELID